MKVTLTDESFTVELEADGSYAPDAMNDMCTQARELWTHLHAIELCLDQDDDE